MVVYSLKRREERTIGQRESRLKGGEENRIVIIPENDGVIPEVIKDSFALGLGVCLLVILRHISGEIDVLEIFPLRQVDAIRGRDAIVGLFGVVAAQTYNVDLNRGAGIVLKLFEIIPQPLKGLAGELVKATVSAELFAEVKGGSGGG
jgi:hypothetical protein